MTPEMMASFQRIHNRKEKELRRLCRDRDFLDAAIALADAFSDATTCLCNYSSVVDGHGRRHDIQEVASLIRGALASAFRTVTGSDYVPEINRRLYDELQVASPPVPSQTLAQVLERSGKFYKMDGSLWFDDPLNSWKYDPTLRLFLRQD